MDESVVRVFEEQKVGKLKLSEAMRIGAKIRPQCLHVLYDGVSSCALGAIYEGALGKPAPLGRLVPAAVHTLLQVTRSGEP